MRPIARLRAWLAEGMAPVVYVDGLAFYCPSRLTEWRAETFLTKEPETLDWIDGFAPDAVLWDVGANIGCYSLYAARRGHRVMAFEPGAANYAVLHQNIERNGFSGQIQAYSLALAARAEAGVLSMSSQIPGSAMHHFTSAPGKGYPQACFSESIDRLVREHCLPRPHHIKLDVDGTECDILQGARETLKHPDFKSLLIEFHEDEDSRPVRQLLTQAGLEFSHKAQAPIFIGTPFSGYWNWVFTRKPKAMAAL